MISKADFEKLHDFSKSETLVRQQVEAATPRTTDALQFLYRYAHWNGYFGCAVASLAGKIGRSRTLFVDPEAEFPGVGDRSVLVSSYFFDAARDEFNDHETPQRDPHRDLAQATVLGVVQVLRGQGRSVDDVRKYLDLPTWLISLGNQVAVGYGNGTPDTAEAVYRAMGYHLGSEVLADQEFTILDSVLRARCPELVERLSHTQVTIAGQDHNAYAWIRIHSGGGGGVEADHFAWAARGLELAIRYTPEPRRAALYNQAILGFRDFARDHREFFENI